MPTPVRSIASSRAPLEALCVIALVAAFLWHGRHAFPGAKIAFAALALAITVASHRRAGESARDIGWRWDTAPRATVYLGCVVFVAAAMILGAAAYLHFTPRIALNGNGLALLLASLVSGWLQQYLLLGFLFRRMLEWLRMPVLATVVTTAAFALLHVPNTFLVVVTLIAGVLSCAIYRRAPNLIVAGIAHGLIVYLLSVCLPLTITGGMQVGGDYLQLHL